MSVTATTSTITRNRLSILADYEIHRTPETEADGEFTSTPQLGEQRSSITEHPPDWPTDHHRIPPYRPVNRELDWSQRAVYLNGIEHVFISVMFAGVWINAGVAQLWRATGGKFNNKLFRFPIGGEW
ncbi:hypothetical protein VTO42DRAFT_5956 [Malbranchea cinnamomea]